MALHIKADGEFAVVSPKQGTEFTLEEIHEYVGGYFEVVVPPPRMLMLNHADRDATTVYEINHKTVMLVNEDGHRLSLPVNQIATVLVPQGWYQVLGDVLLCIRGEEIT